jgi:hypothetical protein
MVHDHVHVHVYVNVHTHVLRRLFIHGIHEFSDFFYTHELLEYFAVKYCRADWPKPAGERVKGLQRYLKKTICQLRRRFAPLRYHA